jgi:chromosome segregation ATPase
MSELQQTLRELHRELGAASQIDPDDRAALESALAEIQRALERSGSAAAQEDSAPGDALEGAAVRLEAGHPGLAGAVRAVVDALAKAGI